AEGRPVRNVLHRFLPRIRSGLPNATIGAQESRRQAASPRAEPGTRPPSPIRTQTPNSLQGRAGLRLSPFDPATASTSRRDCAPIHGAPIPAVRCPSPSACVAAERSARSAGNTHVSRQSHLCLLRGKSARRLAKLPGGIASGRSHNLPSGLLV